MKKRTYLLQKWLAWRDDYRCARPEAVTCQGCDTYYPPQKNAAVMTFEGFNLVHCSNCEQRHPKPNANQPNGQTEPEILFPHVYRRVNRDVACRYIRRFGGSTFSVQTAIDDCEIYLRNCLGLTIATVSMFDKFPKPQDEQVFDEIPY